MLVDDQTRKSEGPVAAQTAQGSKKKVNRLPCIQDLEYTRKVASQIYSERRNTLTNEAKTLV